MKEESQLEEMRAALRGDRERAEEARRRSTENVRALIETPGSRPPEEPRPSTRRGFVSRLLGR